MAKRSIYLTDEIDDQITNLKLPFSAICQKAAKREIAMLAGPPKCETCTFFFPSTMAGAIGTCTFLPKWEKVRLHHHCGNWVIA